MAENREELEKTLSSLGIAETAVGFISGKAPVMAEATMKILGLALSVEPKFSLAEYAHPIKGPVYLDNKTIIQQYKRENSHSYVSPQRSKGEPMEEKRDMLKEIEEWGLILK